MRTAAVLFRWCPRWTVSIPLTPQGIPSLPPLVTVPALTISQGARVTGRSPWHGEPLQRAGGSGVCAGPSCVCRSRPSNWRSECVRGVWGRLADCQGCLTRPASLRSGLSHPLQCWASHIDTGLSFGCFACSPAPCYGSLVWAPANHLGNWPKLPASAWSSPCR